METNVKVTRKDLFARIREAMSNDAEVVEMCDKYIAQLSKPRKKSNAEVEAMSNWRQCVLTWLAEQEEPVTQAIAGEALEVTPAKAGAALRWLVGEGYAVVVDTGNKKDPKHYALA